MEREYPDGLPINDSFRDFTHLKSIHFTLSSVFSMLFSRNSTREFFFDVRLSDGKFHLFMEV